ncbi:MAG: DUF2505 domain-containing protein [Gammaproteobacteria bacterium]
MRKQHEERYPLSVEEMFRIFTDPAFYEARYSGSSARHEFVALGTRGGQFVCDVRQHLLVDSNRVPALARKLIREENVLHTRMVWELAAGPNGERRGNHSFRIEGVPVEVKGTMQLVPDGKGCINRIALDISCSIPLIGGKIAGMLGERADKMLDRNYVNTCRYLKEQGLVIA